MSPGFDIAQRRLSAALPEHPRAMASISWVEPRPRRIVPERRALEGRPKRVRPGGQTLRQLELHLRRTGDGARKSQRARGKTPGALRKDLVGMPSCKAHCGGNLSDVWFRHLFVKEVAHRVHKDHLRLAPPKRLAQLMRYGPDVKAVLEWMALHAPEALGKAFCVTMLAAGTDLGTTADRVPCCIRPLYF